MQQNGKGVKRTLGAEDRGPTDEIHSGQTGKNRREDTN